MVSVRGSFVWSIAVAASSFRPVFIAVIFMISMRSVMVMSALVILVSMRMSIAMFLPVLLRLLLRC